MSHFRARVFRPGQRFLAFIDIQGNRHQSSSMALPSVSECMVEWIFSGFSSFFLGKAKIDFSMRTCLAAVHILFRPQILQRHTGRTRKLKPVLSSYCVLDCFCYILAQHGLVLIKRVYKFLFLLSEKKYLSSVFYDLR